MRTRRYCPHCHSELRKAHLEMQKYHGYVFQCLHCDEDFYRSEVLHKKDLSISANKSLMRRFI